MVEPLKCVNCKETFSIGRPGEVKPEDGAYVCSECEATLCIYCCLSHECGPYYKRVEKEE